MSPNRQSWILSTANSRARSQHIFTIHVTYVEKVSLHDIEYKQEECGKLCSECCMYFSDMVGVRLAKRFCLHSSFSQFSWTLSFFWLSIGNYSCLDYLFRTTTVVIWSEHCFDISYLWSISVLFLFRSILQRNCCYWLLSDPSKYIEMQKFNENI